MATLEYQPSIQRLRCEGEIVGDDEQRHPVLRARGQGISHQAPGAPVQPRGRFIQYQERGLEGQRPGERGEFAQRRRQVVGVLAGHGLEIQCCQRTLDSTSRISSPDPRHPRAERDVIPYRAREQLLVGVLE